MTAERLREPLRKQCGCGATIVLARNARTGNVNPFTALPLTKEGQRYRLVDGEAVRCQGDELGMVSHFATCPNAKQHRR